ncbi:MAG: methionine synthase [Actinomycetota bacterium]|nr:methionine synthase [Actinomycetota bacterium]
MERGPVATGVGSMPGENIVEATRIVLGELPDLPHLPELPDRGPAAAMTGRAVAMIGELGFDLQPAGWRLTDAPGLDQGRARSLLAQDLDTLQELTQGYAGPLKIQVAGPWTLAATVEKSRGDRVLADLGARRELAQALALGVAEHVRDVGRRVPGATVLVQVDEPVLPAVLAGQVPTASGFHRHRSVDGQGAAEALEWVFAACGDEPVAHCCAADVPIGLLRQAGARGLSVDSANLVISAYDELGRLLDHGGRLFLGVVPSTARPPERQSPTAEQVERSVADGVLRVLDMVGFGPDELAGRLVLTPACGLAGASPEYSREALTLVRNSASLLGHS